MVVLAVVMGIVGLLIAGLEGYQLLWVHRMRKLSDVTGTVVARDRQFTGKSNWTYPVVEYTTRDGTQVRRTFRQTARPTIGRTLRIVYDPAAPEGRGPSTRTGLPFVSREPLIYSPRLLLWFWLMLGCGLGMLGLSIAAAVAGG
jgi:hypothetical protein